MILDNEQQRTILLAMIDAATIPGTQVERVYELKAAIRSATVSLGGNIEELKQARGT